MQGFNCSQQHCDCAGTCRDTTHIPTNVLQKSCGFGSFLTPTAIDDMESILLHNQNLDHDEIK